MLKSVFVKVEIPGHLRREVAHRVRHGGAKTGMKLTASSQPAGHLPRLKHQNATACPRQV